MAQFPSGSPPLMQNPSMQQVTEMRVLQLLVCRMITLLSIIIGPGSGTLGQFTPEDPTGDLDSLRADASLQF
jgi:hypothetical protein